MEKQKTKLGARILSQTELNAILPNAESVYEQIEVFRENIPEKTVAAKKDRKETWEQITNNIGIMGCRGAGKTSILRTFHDGLNRKKEKNDVILPIIIPDNMSEGTLLMDVVLGMLKSVVEKQTAERKKEKEKENVFGGDCIYSGRNGLERNYNELVKQYCYIKKDYRDILIRQFTTEQNYVDKTTLVFNSDTEFINRFNAFIEDLLRGEEGSDAKSMLFLFIDDIDLSTTKCMDVVRTLLSYLSNPRIVTFISGDMENFEEELTLEFLRQEKALSEQVFKGIYYSVTDSETNRDEARLLNRKKELAYEYLKKIIPPAYRRTIKYWALEERGNYQVEGESKTEKNGTEKEEKVLKPLSLAELLEAVTEGKVDKAYFTYKKDNQPQFMNVTFHMFDDTSRGLNNVYNVLQELYDRKKPEGGSKKEDEENQLMLWRLIDTIEDSNPFYAQHKETLRKKIIVLEGNQVRVHFDNAFRMLYGNSEDEEGDKDGVFNSRERFRFFLLIDFASRLIGCERGEDSVYGELKGRILREYVMDERIDDKIAVLRNWPEWWRKGAEWWKKGESKSDYADILSILLKLLEQGDFIFNLYLIQFMGREDIYNLVSSKLLLSVDSNREYAYKIAYALVQTLRAMRETEEGQKSYLAGLYVCLPNEMTALLSKLALNPGVIYGERLMEDAYPAWGRYISCNQCTWREANIEYVENLMNALTEFRIKNKFRMLQVEYQNECLRYSIYYSILLDRYVEKNCNFDIETMTQKSVSTGLTVAVMNQLQGVMDKYRVGNLKDTGYKIPEGKSGVSERKEEREKQVISLVDEKNMWAVPYTKHTIYPYLRRKKGDYISQMGEGRLIFDATELFASDGAYTELERCPKGTSENVLAKRLMRLIWKILFLSEEKQKEERFSDGRYYVRLEQAITIQCLLDGFLRSHPRIQYAKKEARQLLMKISELPLVIRTEGWEAIHNEIKDREDSFFGQVFKGSVLYGSGKESLHDRVLAEIGGEKGLEDLIEKVFEAYHEGVSIFSAIENYWLECTEKPSDYKTRKWEEDYFQYCVQKSIITRLKESAAQQPDNQEGREELETIIPKDEYLFIFHSYLRYLQENDNDAEKAGARAEDIVRLANYMLESEMIADRRIQNEIYELVNEKLGITEEDFNELFIR